MEEICDAFEKERKSSSVELREVNDGHAPVSSSAIDNGNSENLEYLETFHLNA